MLDGEAGEEGGAEDEGPGPKSLNSLAKDGEEGNAKGGSEGTVSISLATKLGDRGGELVDLEPTCEPF